MQLRSEAVALSARPKQLLEVRKAQNDDSILRWGTLMERLLEVLRLGRALSQKSDFLFVSSKVSVVQDSGVLAQVTHQWTSDTGVL